jgi:small-conductance mechanosensitive channel
MPPPPGKHDQDERLMLELLQNPHIVRGIITAALLITFLVLRYLAARWIRGEAHILDEQQRRKLFAVRAAITAGLIICLFGVWGDYLQNLLLSLTAVTLAIVVATKELIMCIAGFVMRTTGRMFGIGDWIECHDLHGEVTDLTLLSTKLLEVEPPEYGYGYTGRTLLLPNSLFLTHSVHAASFPRKFVQHRFSITVPAMQPLDPAAALGWLRNAANHVCEPIMEDARKVVDSMNRRLNIEIQGPEPLVTMGTMSEGSITYRLLIFCPRDQANALEQKITRNFLHAVHSGRFAIDQGQTASS